MFQKIGGCPFVYIIPLFLCLSVSASAANLPQGEEPGAQEARFKAEAERAKKRFEQKKARPPEIELKPAEERSAVGAVSFVLREVNIAGVTIFRPEEMHPIYKPYLNTTVSLKDLKAIAAKIEARYRIKGHPTARVFISKEEITQGRVEIKVIEY